MSTATALTAAASAPVDESIDENDRLIQYTQSIRELGIKSVVKDGKIPEDKEHRAFLIAMLDGTSRTALAAKKIKSDEKAAQSQEALAIAIAQGTAAILATAPVMPTGGGSREVIDMDVEEVPGLTYIGTQPVSTAEILADQSLNINET